MAADELGALVIGLPESHRGGLFEQAAVHEAAEKGSGAEELKDGRSIRGLLRGTGAWLMWATWRQPFGASQRRPPPQNEPGHRRPCSRSHASTRSTAASMRRSRPATRTAPGAVDRHLDHLQALYRRAGVLKP